MNLTHSKIYITKKVIFAPISCWNAFIMIASTCLFERFYDFWTSTT